MATVFYIDRNFWNLGKGGKKGISYSSLLIPVATVFRMFKEFWISWIYPILGEPTVFRERKSFFLDFRGPSTFMEGG